MSPAFRDLTTLRVGGDIRSYHRLTSRKKAITTARTVWAEGENWLVLGGGSNLVVADDPFTGPVLHVTWKGKRLTNTSDGSVLLTVQAGEDWDHFVAFCVAEGLQGLESLSGIPGTVGASVIQNIGAYGHEIDEVLDSIEFLDVTDHQEKVLRPDELHLGHRTSALKTGQLQGLVLAVTFRLKQSGLSLPIAYAQLAEFLGVDAGASVSLHALREAVLRLRKSKGMVVDDKDLDSRSVGSFLVNPVVSEKFAYSLPADAPKWLLDHSAPQVMDLSENVDMPGKGVSDHTNGAVKLSAAWLIEHSGVPKGFHLPGNPARVSTEHTLAITNPGGSTAEDVVSLARYIRTQVANTFGVILQPEPTLVGLGLD